MRAFDTVSDSQRVFRCLLQATASPGKLFALPPLDAEPLESVARTLLDHETTFCVAGHGARETEERVSRLTGAWPVPLPEAGFVLVLDGCGGVAADLECGDLERPERGATAVYAVRRLSGGPLALELSGPGVPGERRIELEGLSPEEAGAIRESRSAYPLGVDVYLVDGAGMLAALPRSVRLEVG